MAKQNCWEAKNCGRNTGGAKVGEMGVCPAAIKKEFNKTNNGQNAGRVCWAIVGTFCGGKVQGSFTDKQTSCMNCDFFKKVKQEEADDFVMLPD